MPDLTSAFLPTSQDKNVLMKNVLEIFDVVAQQLKESTESKMDLPERMTTVRHILPYFSLDELRSLQKQIKAEDVIVK